MVVFVKSGFIRSKVDVFEQSGCSRAKLLYSEKVVVFGQKWLYSNKSGFIRENLDIFVLSGCTRVKVVVFGQKWLY